MRNFLQNLSYKFQGFMQGRYGDDELNRCLVWVGLVFLILSCFSPFRILSIFVFIIYIITIFRMFSKNMYKRSQENQKYLKLTGGIRKWFNTYKNMFKDRKEYKYYKCPTCKSFVRIKRPPKGKNIAVRCGQCGNEFTKRTQKFVSLFKWLFEMTFGSCI